MPKVTVKAEFPCPAAQVWRLVTDTRHWDWRLGVDRIETSRDGRRFTEYSDYEPALYEITAFVPRLWYACDVHCGWMEGRWQVFFSPSDMGTQVELVTEFQSRGPIMDLKTAIRARKELKQYIEDLNWGLGVE